MMLAFFHRKSRAAVDDHRRFVPASRLLPRLLRGDYADVEAHFDSARDDVREQLLEGFAASEGAVGMAAAWVAARPQSALAHLVLGASHVAQGSSVGGPLPKFLKLAEEPLHEAARIDRMRPDAFGWMIAAETAGANDRDKLASLFRAALARAPSHWPTHFRYFKAATEQCGGSHEAMFAFARSAAERAPRGSLIHALLAIAFCEFARAAGVAGQRRIRRPGCADEVVGALYAWLDADAGNLAAKLAARDDGFSATATNYFAVACYLCGARDEAQVLVAALQGDIESAPWAWIAANSREHGDAAFVYDRVKRALERG
jgi:hypothetical protein